MTKLKKIGIILIIGGVFIPAILYPFASLTQFAFALQVLFASKGAVYQPGLKDLEVVFKTGNEGRIAIPYNYTLALGITIAFFGIALVALTGKKNKKRR